MMRAARPGLLPLLFAALACAHRPDLPPPGQPLTPTEDEPFRHSAPAPLEDLPVWNPLRVNRRVLANGMRIIVAERHDRPIVSMRYTNRAATLFSKHYTAGLPVLVGDALLEGSRLGKDEVIRNQRVGGMQPRVSTHEDGTDVALDIPAFASAAAIDVMARIVRRPALVVDGIQVAARRQQRWLFEHSGRGNGIVRSIEMGVLFGSDDPGAVTVKDWFRALNRLTTAEVRDFHRRFYVPEASALVVVGDVSAEQVFALAERHFGDWPAQGLTIETHAPWSVPQKREVHAVIAGGEQTLVSLVQPIVGRPHQDYHAFGVLAALVEGNLSRFNSLMRHELGATYGGVTVETHGNRGGGYMRFSVDVENAAFVRAVTVLRTEIERLMIDEVSEDELARARNAYLSSFALFSTDGLADLLARLDMQNLGAEWLARVEAEVGSITPARIRSLAQMHFNPHDASIISLGNPRITKGELEQMGKVRPYTFQPGRR